MWKQVEFVTSATNLYFWKKAGDAIFGKDLPKNASPLFLT